MSNTRMCVIHVTIGLLVVQVQGFNHHGNHTGGCVYQVELIVGVFDIGCV